MPQPQDRLALGIELGSTRVKAVLIGPDHAPIATGGHSWRSELIDGHWTYGLDEVWTAIQSAFAELRDDYRAKHDEELTTVGALGISAMMHGYLPFDADGQQLAAFRTWQDTTTGDASTELSERFGFAIPMRWSIAHLHQAILDGEDVSTLAQLTTLSGYVHAKLTGQRVLGVGDASGMFPIDAATGTYDATMVAAYDEILADRGLPFTILDVLPTVLGAGDDAGSLTEAGAKLLDPSGSFTAGIPMAPPEGDAGTGMVATNSVAVGTANISAGTSIFAMVVLDGPLAEAHDGLDIVATPAGSPVVMVHANNGANDLAEWVALFGEAAKALGADVDTDTLFRTLYEASLEGAPDADGIVAFNTRAGEHVTGLEEGRPMVVRMPESTLNLGNFMRAHLYGALATLRLGFRLLEREGVEVHDIFAHGGLFRTKGVAQRHLSAALGVPVTVGEGASEGGAWGMALLAQFLLANSDDFPSWLAGAFDAADQTTVTATEDEVAGFQAWMIRYEQALEAERAAVAHMTR